VSVEGSYNRTLVVTVTKGVDAAIGDRLVWTWIDIRPKNFTFDGYTVIATDNEVLNVEQIQNQTMASIQGQVGKTTSDTSATTTTTPPVSSVLTNVLGTSLGATANLSNQYTTSAAINQQYVKLGADIVPKELRIYHESERNLDVAGNTLIALTMQVNPEQWVQPARQVDVQRVTKLTLTQNGALAAPDKVSLEVTLEKSPPHCPLLADVTMLYELRHVVDNARSYVEGDQEVQFQKNSTRLEGVEIAPADAVRKPSWRIYGAGDPYRLHPIKISDVFEELLPLDFSTYEQARDFAVWMNHNAALFKTDKPVKIGTAGLELSSGGAGIPFPRGDYYADGFRDPAETPEPVAPLDSTNRAEYAAHSAYVEHVSECQGMNGG
jgi:hypothetical protein